MKKFLLILPLILLTHLMSGQSRLHIGAGFDPYLSFTTVEALGTPADGVSARNWEPFNFKGGVKILFETNALVGFGLGAEVIRKRFGFIHEEQLGTGPVSLLGHSEMYGVAFPVELYFTVATILDPFVEIAPFVGIAPGWDFSVYRNMTRLDSNFDYSYFIDRRDYEKISFGTRAFAGLTFRSLIRDLGFLEWGLSGGVDLGRFPPFDYTITYDGTETAYSESIGLFYVGIHFTYCFLNYEVYNGRLVKRSYR